MSNRFHEKYNHVRQTVVGTWMNIDMYYMRIKLSRVSHFSALASSFLRTVGVSKRPYAGL